MGDNRVCRMSYDMRFASDHVDVGVDIFLVKSISYHHITSSGGIVSFPVNNINMRQLNRQGYQYQYYHTCYVFITYERR